MEDPIFDPWSVDRETTSSSLESGSSLGTLEVLRRIATPRLEAIGRRLGVARHQTGLEDLLDEPPGLLRFQLRPWPGPFPSAGPGAPAMLEIGLGESNEQVNAWYWLDGFEAPDEVRSVASERLTAAWVERVILDFLRAVLERR